MSDFDNTSSLKRLKAGDAISASWLNKLADIARGNNYLDLPEEKERELYSIPYHNMSGFTVPPGGILFPDSQITIAGKPGINGSRPTLYWSFCWYVNSMQSVVNGRKGWCSVALEPVLIQANIDTLVPGQNAGPSPNSFLMQPNIDGFMVVGALKTLFGGQFYYPCVQDFPKELHGQADVAGEYDDLIAVNLLQGLSTGAGGAGITVSGFQIPNVRLRTDAVEEDQELVVSRMHNQPYGAPIKVDA